jgi:hypothetical protein
MSFPELLRGGQWWFEVHTGIVGEYIERHLVQPCQRCGFCLLCNLCRCPSAVRCGNFPEGAADK